MYWNAANPPTENGELEVMCLMGAKNAGGRDASCGPKKRGAMEVGHIFSTEGGERG